MALINSFLASIRRDDEGQGLAEYALILALIAIVAIIALIFLGNQVSQHPLDGRRLDLVDPPHRNAGPPARPAAFVRQGQEGSTLCVLAPEAG